MYQYLFAPAGIFPIIVSTGKSISWNPTSAYVELDKSISWRLASLYRSDCCLYLVARLVGTIWRRQSLRGGLVGRYEGQFSCCLGSNFQPIFLRSFALMQKNQKIKAYTPEATNSHRSAKIKISETRFAQTAEISLRSARNLLNASYVRPILPILYMV